MIQLLNEGYVSFTIENDLCTLLEGNYTFLLNLTFFP
jgi:hypothetical protein